MTTAVLDGIRAQLENWVGPGYITVAEARQLFPGKLEARERDNRGFAQVYNSHIEGFVGAHQVTQRLVALKPDPECPGKMMIDHDRVEVWEAPHLHAVAWDINDISQYLIGVTYQIRQFVHAADNDSRVQVSPPIVFAQPCAMGFDLVRVTGEGAHKAYIASQTEAAEREIFDELGVTGIGTPRIIGQHIASNTFCQSWTPIYAVRVDHRWMIQNPGSAELILKQDFLPVSTVLQCIQHGAQTVDGLEVNWGAALPNMSFMKWLMTVPEAWRQAMSMEA